MGPSYASIGFSKRAADSAAFDEPIQKKAKTSKYGERIVTTF